MPISQEDRQHRQQLNAEQHRTAYANLSQDERQQRQQVDAVRHRNNRQSLELTELRWLMHH